MKSGKNPVVVIHYLHKIDLVMKIRTKIKLLYLIFYCCFDLFITQGVWLYLANCYF